MMVLPSIVLVTLGIIADSLGEEILQSLNGVVGGGNYTYYRLSRSGHLRIEMESTEGDADLYVSDTTASPDFEDYTQESVTCGLEVVEIPASYSRPVGIGVYGYPIYETSKYRITIILMSQIDDLSYNQLMHQYYNYERSAAEANPDDSRSKERNKESVKPVTSSDDDEDDEGSVLWQIIVTLLKVFFEIMF